MALTAIVNAYFRRICRGEITIDDVPIQIREQVKVKIQQNGGNE